MSNYDYKIYQHMGLVELIRELQLLYIFLKILPLILIHITGNQNST